MTSQLDEGVELLQEPILLQHVVQAMVESERRRRPDLFDAALSQEGGTGRAFLFDGGAVSQLPVFSTAPGMEDHTPLFGVVDVTLAVDPVFGRAAPPPLLESVADVEAAVADGRATAEATSIVVNYPAVRWPRGELPVDNTVELPLAGGPLLSSSDIENMTVTFKLHQCYPESRCIIIDTSALPMAPRICRWRHG